MLTLDSDSLEYITANIDPEPEVLARIYRHTHLHHLYPRMCSDHLQGRILCMLTTMIRPKRVLELGTYTGYSTLSIAQGITPPGHITTIEINDEAEDQLLETFARHTPPGVTINLRIGPALDIIPTLAPQAPFDLIFIDANKRQYTQYYEAVMPLLAPGGYILADNTLWDGKLSLDSPGNDAQSKAIFDFNAHVAADPRVSVVILPVRDGLSIIRRLPSTPAT